MPGLAEFEIPKHYVPMFKANMEFRPGYDDSILRPHVMTGTASGEGASPLQIFGRAKIREKTDRYGDTPIDEIERWRTWVFPKTIEGGDLLDNIDAVKSLIDPTSPIVQAFREELASQSDTTSIIPAFFGPRYEGKDVSQAVSNGPINFDDAKYMLNINLGSAGDASPWGMSIAKIRAGIKLFKQLKVIRGNMRKEKIKLGLTAQQWEDLLKEAQVVHGDTIYGRPLAKGDLPQLFDVEFVESEDFEKSGNDRLCPMWLPSGVHCLGWTEKIVKIGPDPGKRFNIRVYVQETLGTARVMDEKVLKIPCRE